MGGQDVFETCFEVLSQKSSKDANENCEYIIRLALNITHQPMYFQYNNILV